MPDVLSQHPLEATRIIYTLGMSNREIEEFIDLLKIYDIQILIDVRRFPTSKFEWFKRKNLPRALARQMIGYVFLGNELGEYRKEGYDVHLSSEDFQRSADGKCCTSLNKTGFGRQRDRTRTSHSTNIHDMPSHPFFERCFIFEIKTIMNEHPCLKHYGRITFDY